MTLGRQGIAVDQPPGGELFPFVRPSDDLHKLVGDAHLSYLDDLNQLTLPFHIRWLSGFGTNVVASPITPAHAHDMLIVDANGRTVFDSRDADYHTKTWSDRLEVIEWYQGEQVLRVTKYTAWAADETPRTWDTYFEPASAVLDARCVLQVPRRVRSLRVGGTRLRGSNAKFVGGYNFELAASPGATQPGGRVSTKVALDVSPGGGEGRFPIDCGETTQFRRINGLPADDNGNFVLDALDCYRLERPLHSLANSEPRSAIVQDHTLQLSNSCSPCCECSDYVAVYEAIRRLRDRFAEYRRRGELVRNQYAANRDRFLSQKDCRDSRPIRTASEPSCGGVLRVAVGVCNSTDTCLQNVTVVMSFVYDEDSPLCDINATTAYDPDAPATLYLPGTFRSGNSGNVYCNSPTKEKYVLRGSYPTFWGYFDAINPGTMGTLFFELHFPDGDTGELVTMVADAYVWGADFPGFVSDAPFVGYTPGSGPTTQEAFDARLMECPPIMNAILTTHADCV